jgi:nucleoside-diphosphate-sugar epimerase
MIYISGLSGKLGKTVREVFEQRGVKYKAITRKEWQSQQQWNPSLFIHMAGSTAFWDEKALTLGNEGLALTLTKRLPPTTPVIFISSVSVYGNAQGEITEDTPTQPSTPYGKAKLNAEHILSKHFQSLTVLRVGPLIGKHFHIYRVMLTLMTKTGLAFDDDKRVPFTYDKDVAHLLLHLIQHPKPGTYNITGRCVTLRHIKQVLERSLHTSFTSVKPPLTLLKAFADLNHYCAPIFKPVFTHEHLRVFALDRCVNSDKARTTLGWSPTDLSRVLNEVMEAWSVGR